MKVILVEDNDNTATLTELFFEKTGFADRVDRTYRIKPFESLVNINKYDLAIVDYHLQFFDAPEFIRLIKESKLNSHTPVVVVSHELSIEEQREVNSLGVKYIRRPDDYLIFVELLKSEMRKFN